MHKLISLAGLLAPCAVGLPPVIYATSTAGDWEKNWVAKVEGDDEVLRCTGNSDNVENIGYRILVRANSNNPAGIELFADHISGYKVVRHGFLFRFQAAEQNFMLSDANDREHASEGGGGVYCKSNVRWNKEGVMIGGQPVQQENRGSVEWENNLSSIEQQIELKKESDCKSYFMKVVCQLKWKGGETGQVESKKGGEGSRLTISGSLPTLVYRPF